MNLMLPTYELPAFELQQLCSALAQIRPFELDELVPMGLAYVLDGSETLEGLTPVCALAIACAHPDLPGRLAPLHERLEQLVGDAWVWLAGDTSFRLRWASHGFMGKDPERDAAHEEVLSTLLLLALDSELPRPDAAESALQALRNLESNRIGVAKMLRDLMWSPVSGEVLDSLSFPDAGSLINSDAVRSISNAGVHQLGHVLKHFHEVAGYVWWWARRSVLAGVDRPEAWARALDGLAPSPDGADELAQHVLLERTLSHLEGLSIERAMSARIQASSNEDVVRVRVSRPLRPPITARLPAVARAGYLSNHSTKENFMTSNLKSAQQNLKDALLEAGAPEHCLTHQSLTTLLSVLRSPLDPQPGPDRTETRQLFDLLGLRFSYQGQRPDVEYVQEGLKYHNDYEAPKHLLVDDYFSFAGVLSSDVAHSALIACAPNYASMAPERVRNAAFINDVLLGHLRLASVDEVESSQLKAALNCWLMAEAIDSAHDSASATGIPSVAAGLKRRSRSV